MINIKLIEYPKTQDYKIRVEGHAGYAEKGKDIVCSAVSILVDTFIATNGKAVKVTEREGLKEIDTIPGIANVTFPGVFFFFVTGIKLLMAEYPDYVNISLTEIR
ncbi:MAG: ribosomal-processing cysteine protease Prp [Lachnospiraceae bacterium]|jgi:uncharacterized protein YsxB (DUF464 family)|nr:ribosomal-processing cysteine protease Prp [Lachnospiraceae bacterium]